MKQLSILLIIAFTFSCNNGIYSDKEKIVRTTDGNTFVYFKNSFENGYIKDSLAALEFDKGNEQSSHENFEKAKFHYVNANKLEPNNVIIINSLGNTYAELDDFEKSYELFEKSLRIDSLDTSTYLSYGFCKAENDQFKKAIEIYNKGIDLESSGEKRGYFYYNLSKAYYNLDNYEKAKHYINKSTELVNDKVLKMEISSFRDFLNKK